MISFKTNTELLPDVISSEGFYEVTPENTGVMLKLHQNTILRSIMPIIGRFIVNKEDAFSYLEDIKKNAERKYK
jgi:hypothetical protein